MTDDLKDHIAHGDGGFLVEDIIECRHRDGVWEVLIKWFGLEDVENSWENAVCIYEDMPVAFKRLCRKKMRNNPLFNGMWVAVEHFLGHPLKGGSVPAAPTGLRGFSRYVPTLR